MPRRGRRRRLSPATRKRIGALLRGVGIAILVVMVAAVVLLAVRNVRRADAEARPRARADQVTACDLISPEESRVVLGVEVVPEDDPTPTTCGYVAANGRVRLTVRWHPTPRAVSFRRLLTDRNAPAAELGDESRWLTEGRSDGGALVVRVRGEAIVLELTGRPAALTAGVGDDGAGDASPAQLSVDDVRQAVQVKLAALAEIAIPRVPELTLTERDVPSVAVRTCTDAAMDRLSRALQLDDADVPSMSVLGATGCRFTTESGVDISVEVLGTEYDQAQLDGLGRRLVQDGSRFVWRSQVVPYLGEYAVWQADPITPARGQLYVIYGSKTVRTTVTSPVPEAPVRTWAIAAASELGPPLTG